LMSPGAACAAARMSQRVATRHVPEKRKPRMFGLRSSTAGPDCNALGALVAGDVSYLPAGHDAWVVGNEPVVLVDITGMGSLFKPR
jgi:hypothetical protein